MLRTVCDQFRVFHAFALQFVIKFLILTMFVLGHEVTTPSS